MSRDLDNLTARVRRADPAAHADPHANPHATAPDALDLDAGRAAVTAARARRGERGRRGVGAGLGGLAAIATAVVVAVGATTAGPVAAKPRVRQIVARAAQATAPEPNAILMIDSGREVEWHGGGNDGGLYTRGTGFVLFDGEGDQIANRQVVTDVRGENMLAGVEDASRRENGDWVLEKYDPRTRRTTAHARAYMVPSPVFQAHKLFVRAQRGDTRMRLLGQTRVGGRPAWRLLVTGADEEPLDGDRDELLVDVATYEPLELRKHSESSRGGVTYTHDSVERIHDYEVLPDTPANRTLLKINGPLTPAR